MYTNITIGQLFLVRGKGVFSILNKITSDHLSDSSSF